MDDEEEETTPAPAPAATVVHNESSDLTQPVIDHTERLTRLEERQAKHEEDVARRLSETESRINESVSARLSAVEEAARAAAAAAAESAAAPPEEALETLEDEAVEVPRVVERPRGARGRRHARRKR